MEHYIQIILLLAPGFIAKEIARMLGNVKRKSSTLDQVINYFVYSLFTLIILMIVYLLLQSKNYSHTTIYLIMMVTSVITGIIVGGLWQLLFKRMLRAVTKWITIKTIGYEFYQEDSLLNNNLMDGNQHFIEVIKDGERIALGEFLGASFSSDTAMELKVNSHPVFAEWLSSESYSYLFPQIQVFIDITNNVKIIEYDYPKGFFDKNFDVKKYINSSSERLA